ncbi:MAG: Rpn family recombination-promoting nuclease/putative transposase [Defluviitaleaceae bacterium]|nr:Rpn family recombination-promoting nuclease/putative transposase [Defluviitaleaceae bacterium]
MLDTRARNKGKKLEYTFKSDVLFKMLFVKHPHLLKRLVAVLLTIPVDTISEFIITNTDMPPEEIGKKFCRLDINMIVDGKRVNLEIQVEDEGNYPERALFHFARIYSSALPAGDNYSLLPRTIIISILDFSLFACEDVHSEFQVLEVNRHTPLTDKLSLHFFELPKMPELSSVNLNSEKDLWLALFNAETEEELEELSKTGGAVMSEAVQAYHGITDTEEFRNREWMRVKIQHDTAQALYNATRKGVEAMLLSAIKNNVPAEAIEAMRKSSGIITEARLAELQEQVQG